MIKRQDSKQWVAKKEAELDLVRLGVMGMCSSVSLPHFNVQLSILQVVDTSDVLGIPGVVLGLGVFRVKISCSM